MNIKLAGAFIPIFISIMSAIEDSDSLLSKVLDPKEYKRLCDEQKAEKRRARRRAQYAAMDPKKKKRRLEQQRVMKKSKYAAMDTDKKWRCWSKDVPITLQ